jgi:hypothetical protein
MRLKLIALMLALTVTSWAQTATPSAPSTPQQGTVSAEAKACPCCDKGSAKVKDGHACCARHAMAAKDGKEPACCAGKEKAACCAGENAKSCQYTSASETAAACCGGRNCGKDCGKECGSTKPAKELANSCSGRCCAGHRDNHSSPGGSN